VTVQPLRHSYTNDVRGNGTVVVKRYTGPDAAVRHARERNILERLHGKLPTPPLLKSTDPDDTVDDLRMGYIAGVPGQELIEAGHATPVLRACGKTLRTIHQVDVTDILPAADCTSGSVLVHGDYGPNNVLVHPNAFHVTGVVDWEWTHRGQPLEDLAWCEWIVRMHHREHVEAIDEFFDAYGQRPTWLQRQTAMLTRCQELIKHCRDWSPEAVSVWQHRLDVTAAWTE
jgi:aminoglycoside phosphotransferase (APT) family kinase protein